MPEYAIWATMIQRCTNPKDAAYKNYGARGVTVCQRWRRSFKAFLSDMGTRPSSEHSIERTNNAIGYTPENCRWATRTEQNRNTRRNVPLTVDGRTQLMADWATERGLAAATICKRIKRGWSVSRAVMTPSKPIGGAARARSSAAGTRST